MKRKKRMEVVDFDEKIKAVKYERILQTLKDILKIEEKAQMKDGKCEIDYAATCSALKRKPVLRSTL